MWVNRNKPKLKTFNTIKYLSASSLSQYENNPNTFYCTRLAETLMPRDAGGLAANIGTAFDILVKKDLMHKHGVMLHDVVEESMLDNSLDKNSEHYEKAWSEGKRILRYYKLSGIIDDLPIIPIPRRWHQIEGDYRYKLNGVPFYAKLDAVVFDPFTRQLAPFDWKVVGGAAKTGVSPRKGFADFCDAGQWAQKPHKSYTSHATADKSPNSGYEGVNIPMDLIDKKFAAQFCIYGWALQAVDGFLEIADNEFKDFPVHFDSAVYNGKDRRIKIYAYRAIITADFQRKLYKRARRVWDDLATGCTQLLDNISSKYNIKEVESAARGENWW